MPHPVSVIVPHRLSRENWFLSRGLPSIERNDPAEIIIESQEGGACEKRNAGAAKAGQPYLLFVDDDAILRDGMLKKLLQAIGKKTFAYCDVIMVTYPGVPYPHAAGLRRAQPWSHETLKRGNYIETTSLLRRDRFPGFDPDIRRFQDWDLWLTLAKKGYDGKYVPEALLELHHFDIGITASVPFEPSLAAIKKKHRLP